MAGHFPHITAYDAQAPALLMASLPHGNAMSVRTALEYLVGVGAAALIGTGAYAASTRQAEPRVIEIVAKRYAFVPSRIEVLEGETVRLVVRSADGTHGVQIKKFKVSEEVPRGSEPVTIEFTATAIGEFEIACAAFCGKGHEEMRGKLVVLPRDTRAR
jgi:cytochrome c oxidase subunit 2